MIRKKISTALSVVAVFVLMVPLVYFGFPKMFADSVYPEPPSEITGIIDECASIFGVDKSLLVATMLKESGFNQNAVSPAGAMGYMQLMPATFSGLKNRVAELQGKISGDPFDAKTNICLGAAHLAGLMGTYGGNENAALIAYNGGDAAARRYLAAGSAEGLVSETRAYAPKILAAREYYASIFGYGVPQSGGSEGISALTITGLKPAKTPTNIKVEAKGTSDVTGAFWKAFINDYFKTLISN